ncbi:hypothetical protein GCM10022236_06340 [Microlunatus ginsengisoli]|uniref:Exo-alpha-sialidase n=1 Tax=Microlunatus ginsengisoli TaxID=363863 RepID=A0ABP6ZGM8_9ACTN
MVEVTTNGGKTWRRVDPQLRALVRLQAYGDHSVFAVGADAACRPAYTSTESPDRRWHSAPVVWDTWFSDPKDPARVHAPGGRTSRPCGDAVRAFSATSRAGAAVICGDGRVRVSTTGRTWRTIQSRSTAVALGSSDRGLLLAYPSASCQGVVVRKLRATTGGGSCAEELDAVAIAGHGTTTWAWVGDHMSVR